MRGSNVTFLCRLLKSGFELGLWMVEEARRGSDQRVWEINGIRLGAESPRVGIILVRKPTA